MKFTRLRAVLPLAALVTWSAHAAEAPVAPAEKTQEFYAATVLLIDHDKGLLGVALGEEGQGKEKQKMSFEVDLEAVYVTNPLGQYLQFADVAVGDFIDFFVEPSEKDGVPRVTYVFDYSRFAPR
jgi:hypothetical protein